MVGYIFSRLEDIVIRCISVLSDTVERSFFFDGMDDNPVYDVFVCVIPVWTGVVLAGFVLLYNSFVGIGCGSH